MNIRTLIIRFGIGTLVAASAAVSAQESVIDLASAEIVSTTSDSVSADITARYGQFIPDSAARADGEVARTRTELRPADDMARKLDDQLERRLAAQLERVI